MGLTIRLIVAAMVAALLAPAAVAAAPPPRPLPTKTVRGPDSAQAVLMRFKVLAAAYQKARAEGNVKALTKLEARFLAALSDDDAAPRPLREIPGRGGDRRIDRTPRVPVKPGIVRPAADRFDAVRRAFKPLMGQMDAEPMAQKQTLLNDAVVIARAATRPPAPAKR